MHWKIGLFCPFISSFALSNVNLVKVVTQGGSDGLIDITLLGIHILVIDGICSIKFSQYVLKSSF